ncbi:hypothetical protein KKG24_02280 [Patescibacteria group bacterium]|nr:hypothetical protein [Patescibacteria group bacterium]
MEKNNEIKNTIVETYAGDMAEVIENDKEGLIKKIIHGEEEHEQEKNNLSPESKKNRLFMLIGILLIMLGLLVLSFFFLKKDGNNTVSVEKQFVPIIFNDQSVFLEVLGFKKEEIVQTVLSEISNLKVKLGGVEGVYLTENKQIIGLRRFLSLIKGNFVPGDNPIFISNNFLMGAVFTGLKSTLPNAGDFFILLKMRSTADIFDSLRIWENKMFFDLYGFFGVKISAETNYLLNKEFQDGVVENKNARMLYDKDGGIVMMYIFANDNSIIITDSQFAAHEIMLRLASAQKKQ